MDELQARRAYLNRYRLAIRQEAALCDRIEKAETPPAEWREQSASQVVKGLAIRREVEQVIESLPDARQICVLRYRFLACLTVEQTARQLGIDTGSIHRIQNAALSRLHMPEEQG